MVMVAVGRPDPVAASLPTTYGRLTHQPTQTVSTVSLALGTEAGLDTRTAVGLAALLVDASDLLLELQIFLGACRWLVLTALPVIIPTG